jgi:hypothetical protein
MDYSAIRAFFDDQKYHYFTFHVKSEKPIKAVIRHLPSDNPAEDIASSLQDLGFRIINCKTNDFFSAIYKDWCKSEEHPPFSSH